MWFIISYSLGLIPLLIYVSFLAFKVHTFDTLTEFTLSIYNFRSIFVSRWRFFFKIFLIKIVIALFHSSISLFPNVRGENVSQINNQRSFYHHYFRIEQKFKYRINVFKFSCLYLFIVSAFIVDFSIGHSQNILSRDAHYFSIDPIKKPSRSCTCTCPMLIIDASLHGGLIAATLLRTESCP